MSMKFFKNPATGEVHAFEWPADEDWVKPGLVEMTDAETEDHINPPRKIPTRSEVEQARLLAYADPVNGSDRYHSEASAEADRGNLDKAEECKILAKARRDEIQKENPWPDE